MMVNSTAKLVPEENSLIIIHPPLDSMNPQCCNGGAEGSTRQALPQAQHMESGMRPPDPHYNIIVPTVKRLLRHKS